MRNVRWAYFLVVAVSLFLFAGCGLVKNTKAAKKSVTQFHETFNKSGFAAIYASAHPDFKKASPEKDFLELLNAIRRKLGTVQDATSTGFHVNSHNFQTYVTLTYQTKFSGGEGTETFTYRLDGDNALLYKYHINSNALIVK